MRVGVIFNPSEAGGRQERSVNKAVWTALESLPSDEAASFIRKLLKEKNYDDFLAGKRAAEEFLSSVGTLLPCRCFYGRGVGSHAC